MSTRAECANGQWNVVSVLPPKGCDDEKCPPQVPKPETQCKPDGNICEYYPKKCANGSSYMSTRAECTNGQWNVVSVLPPKGCDDEKCPLQVPKPETQCKPDGNICEYNPKKCANGTSYM